MEGIPRGGCPGFFSVFVISTFDTDYALIKKDHFQRALDILENAGYEIVG